MNVLRRAVLSLSLLSLAGVPTAAHAGKKKRPKSVSQLTKYEFVEDTKGDDTRMWIVDEKWGRIGGKKNGIIQFTVGESDGKEIVHIDMVRGSRKTRGVGKLLKQEVLDRYPVREIESELEFKNKEKLLKAWAKGFPHRSSDTNGKALFKKVPALSFDEFDYVITVEMNSSGLRGAIMLEMKPAKQGKKGSITIDDPEALDDLLANERPEYLRKKDRPVDEKENQDDAKKAGKLIEKIAKDVSRKESVDEDDLLEFLWEMLDDQCGKGGRDGKGWAEGCLFTQNGSDFSVKVKRNNQPFRIKRWADDASEYFIKENR